MWNIFLDFFSNIFNILITLIFLCLGIIIGILFRPRWGNSVMKIMPKDHRFVDFDIDEETAVSISCKDKKGFPPHRFIKLGAGFVGRVGRFLKKSITRYIGKEGTAYVWQTVQDKLTEIPGGLPAALLSLWGKKFYESIPEPQRRKVEENSLCVTVDLEDGLTPPGFSSVSEEDIKREEDREAARTLWQGKKQEERGQWLNMLVIGIAGFGIACALQIIGILRI